MNGIHVHVHVYTCSRTCVCIRESIDSLCRDGTDTPKLNCSECTIMQNPPRNEFMPQTLLGSMSNQMTVSRGIDFNAHACFPQENG